MKTHHLSIIVLSTALLASCTPKVPATEEVGPYTVTTVGEGIYDIVDGNSSNPAGYHYDVEGNRSGLNNTSDMYLIVGKTDALLIDLSNNVKWADNAKESILKIVNDRIGNKKLHIAITHSHGDHTGMKDAFIENESVDFYLPRPDFEARSVFPAERSILFDEGFVLDFGKDLRFNTLFVPGHTAGSCVYFLEGKNVGFTGDAIGSGVGVWLFSKESIETYSKGIEHFIEYLENPANGLDVPNLKFYGGHAYQSAFVDGFDAQCVYDTQTLIHKMRQGEIEPIPAEHGRGQMNADYIYNKGKITTNDKSGEEFVNSALQTTDN